MDITFGTPCGLKIVLFFLCHFVVTYIYASDLKAKAKRWDEKQVDGLKRKRDKLVNEIKDLAKQRRREPELQNLQSQIDGLETRLRFCRKDRDVIVSYKVVNENVNKYASKFVDNFQK